MKRHWVLAGLAALTIPLLLAGSASAQTVADRIAKNKQDLADILEKGKHQRLSGGERQQLANLWFSYEGDARMPQFKREGEPDPVPVRSEQLEKDHAEVEKIQNDFAKNAQAEDQAAREQQQATSNYGIYLAVYFTAKKCADAGFVFSQEIVDNIVPIVKDKARNVPQEIKDRGWQALQNHYNSIVVNDRDCSQAMQQAQYILPQDVFTTKDAPKNPF